MEDTCRTCKDKDTIGAVIELHVHVGVHFVVYGEFTSRDHIVSLLLPALSAIGCSVLLTCNYMYMYICTEECHLAKPGSN